VADETELKRCPECAAVIVFSGLNVVPFEVIAEPLDGGPTRLEHTAERCRFHQFLRPPRPEHPLHRAVAPPTVYATDGHPRPEPRIDRSRIGSAQRWGRVD
jgi:hypothetical protein